MGQDGYREEELSGLEWLEVHYEGNVSLVCSRRILYRY